MLRRLSTSLTAGLTLALLGISGVPHRITTDERSELSRIVRGVASEDT